MYVESAKGECNLGQHEIAFRYAEAMTTCDNHSIYKTGAKEIAAQEGMSITFMAKPNDARGKLLPHPPVRARLTAGAPGDWPGTGVRPVEGRRAFPGRTAGRACAS